MTIICLEGASGIGKTTASKFMAEKYGFVRIPEVNELFKRSHNEACDWYFQMQVKRWELAKEVSESGNVAVLDGDHLQPIWYNWIFEDLKFQPVSEVLSFYSKAFLEEKLNYPDAYVVLSLELNELRSRKENDSSRSRRNFETHLRLIKSQREYFDALKAGGLSEINFVESTSPVDIANFCLSIDRNITRGSLKPSFSIIENFIATKVTNA